MYITIFLVFYITLVFTDLIPMIKKKDRDYLWFYFPVYAVTLIVNILIGLNFRSPSITAILEKWLSNFIK